MLLEVLNIGKLELFAGMTLVQLMSLKWGSPLESLGNLALIVGTVLRRHQTADVNESVVELPLLLACSLKSVLLDIWWSLQLACSF